MKTKYLAGLAVLAVCAVGLTMADFSPPKPMKLYAYQGAAKYRIKIPARETVSLSEFAETVEAITAPEPMSGNVHFVAAPAETPKATDPSEMTDAELSDALALAKADVAAFEAEQRKRNHAKAVASAPVGTSPGQPKRCPLCGAIRPPYAQASGECICGPECQCACKTGVSSAANFTYSDPDPLVEVDQTTTEMQPVVNRGLFGIPRPNLLGYSYQPVQVTRRVAVPASSVGQYATVSRTYATSGTNLSSRVVSGPSVSYLSSPPRVQTRVTIPSVQSSTVIYGTPRAGTCVRYSDGSVRCSP